MKKDKFPTYWEKKKIHEVVDVVSGGTPDKKNKEYWKNGDIAWATPTDITSNGRRFIDKTKLYITKKGLEESSANLLPTGSVLLTSRATIGERCINLVPMATNQGFKSFICKENLHNKYLYYLIGLIKKEFIALSGGSTFLEISKKDIENFEIHLPLKVEQKKIASILSTVDEQIENTGNLINSYILLKKGLMQILLTEGIGHTEFKETSLGKVPKKWVIIDLINTGEYINGRAFKPSDWQKEGIPIIRIQNLNNTEEEFNYFEEEVEDKYVVNNGELLFAWSGSIGLHIWNRGKAFLNQHIFKVVPNKKIIQKYFLYYILSKQIEGMKTFSHGTTMKHITRKNLELIKVPIPQIEEQNKIVLILSTIDKIIESYKSEKYKLETLKKGLMQQLLTGKIRVKV